MHIPGGFINGQTCWITNVISGGLILTALSKLKEVKNNQKFLFYGLAAALIFALQMLNFPIVNGTSGHFLGGALAYLVAGPWIGSLLIGIVLAIQAFLFNDGGILALGANILCMGIVGVWVPYLIQKILPRQNKYVVIALAAWGSVLFASLTASILLAISGTIPLAKVLPAMLGFHALIGVGEAAITLVAYALFVDESALLKIRLWAQRKSVLIPLAFTAIILAVFISPLASSFPDGLEKVAALKGFMSKAMAETIFISPMADYTLPLNNQAFATGSVGFMGVFMVFGFSLAMFLTTKLFFKTSKKASI
jgi:cobalt/nickel transport system permease protein